MAKQIDKMDQSELEAAIDEVDRQISEHGDAIAKARKAQRPLLSKKDDLVNALVTRIRETGPNLTLGDDRG